MFQIATSEKVSSQIDWSFEPEGDVIFAFGLPSPEEISAPIGRIDGVIGAHDLADGRLSVSFWIFVRLEQLQFPEMLRLQFLNFPWQR